MVNRVPQRGDFGQRGMGALAADAVHNRRVRVAHEYLGTTGRLRARDSFLHRRGSAMDAVGHICIVSNVMQEQSPRELMFDVTQEADGGYTAECLGYGIFTQGASWSELRYNVREAVEAYCFDSPLPESVRLHLVRDELLAMA